MINGVKLSIEVKDSGNNSEAVKKQTSSSMFGLKLVDLLAMEYNGKVSASYNGQGKVAVELNLPRLE